MDAIKPDAWPALARQFSAAPHRLMFFAGASAVLVSMGWWALYLHAARFGLVFPLPPVAPAQAHAVLSQYGMLGPFIFGFLLTVFPRWLGRPALQRRDYVPVFLGVFGGYLLAHAGLLGSLALLRGGVLLMLAGWWRGIWVLGRVFYPCEFRDAHANSAYLALNIGGLGLLAYAMHLFGAPPSFARVAVMLGLFGLLLPMYFTVCHRMIPFFSANMVPGYRLVRPRSSLPLLWGLLVARALALAWTQPLLAAAFDVALALLFAAHWVAWQPWSTRRTPLLFVLHLGFAWLPVAFTLFAVQDFALAAGDALALGRAPQHALTVGFFGSLLVAMVTRVTQGHSGRPLVLGRIPAICFVAVQFVAVMRIASEFTADHAAWWAFSACAWLIAFLPWVLRSLWIYLTPRADGAAG